MNSPFAAALAPSFQASTQDYVAPAGVMTAGAERVDCPNPDSLRVNQPIDAPQPRLSCQFCQHFRLEFACWGQCKVLGVLIQGQDLACTFHQPCFTDP